MEMIQDINYVFGKWFSGEHLREDEVEFITYSIILLVLIIVCIGLLAKLACLCQWGTRIKWFFEDICHMVGWNTGSYNENKQDEKTSNNHHTHVN